MKVSTSVLVKIIIVLLISLLVVQLGAYIFFKNNVTLWNSLLIHPISRNSSIFSEVKRYYGTLNNFQCNQSECEISFVDKENKPITLKLYYNKNTLLFDQNTQDIAFDDVNEFADAISKLDEKLFEMEIEQNYDIFREVYLNYIIIQKQDVI